MLSSPEEVEDRPMTSGKDGTPSIPSPNSAGRFSLPLRLARLTVADSLHVGLRGLHIIPLAQVETPMDSCLLPPSVPDARQRRGNPAWLVRTRRMSFSTSLAHRPSRQFCMWLPTSHNMQYACTITTIEYVSCSMSTTHTYGMPGRTVSRAGCHRVARRPRQP